MQAITETLDLTESGLKLQELVTALFLPIGEPPNRVEREARMWTWFNCYLSGRHQYGMWCEPGTIFLRCVHCGRRSAGWSVDPRRQAPAAERSAKAPLPAVNQGGARVVPFDRRVAS